MRDHLRCELIFFSLYRKILLLLIQIYHAFLTEWIYFTIKIFRLILDVFRNEFYNLLKVLSFIRKCYLISWHPIAFIPLDSLLLLLVHYVLQ